MHLHLTHRAQAALVYATALLVIFRKNTPAGFIALPATVLFALPALRNVQPGAPPIGTYADAASLIIEEVRVVRPLWRRTADPAWRRSWSPSASWPASSASCTCPPTPSSSDRLPVLLSLYAALRQSC